jgi:hypothetical protein
MESGMNSESESSEQESYREARISLTHTIDQFVNYKPYTVPTELHISIVTL